MSEDFLRLGRELEKPSETLVLVHYFFPMFNYKKISFNKSKKDYFESESNIYTKKDRNIICLEGRKEFVASVERIMNYESQKNQYFFIPTVDSRPQHIRTEDFSVLGGILEDLHLESKEINLAGGQYNNNYYGDIPLNGCLNITKKFLEMRGFSTAVNFNATYSGPSGFR